MATIAAEMMLRCATDCSLSLNDFDIERRPYRKNCGCACALYKLKGVCSNAYSKKNSISFTMKKTWPDCSSSMTVSSTSASSNFSCQTSYSTDSALTSLRIRDREDADGDFSSTNGQSN